MTLTTQEIKQSLSITNLLKHYGGECTNQSSGEGNIIKKKKEIEVTPVVTAFSVLQKIVRIKDSATFEKDLDKLENERIKNNQTHFEVSQYYHHNKRPSKI
ncbi:MAG: hypothetical protein ACI9CD_000865 [Candidatus Deianiraeaceae bacterium]|jgi:hypothetical protein